MAATTAETGIFHVTVRTTEGRVVEYDGDEDEIDEWLNEFRLADTLVNVERHEMTQDELEAYGPIYNSPGA